MTANLDLHATSAEFLNQCGSCDAGVLMSCTCTTRDYRPAMLALVREVERLRAFMNAVADRQEQQVAAALSPRIALGYFADEIRDAVGA